MKLLDFNKKFPNEDSCRAYFKHIRLKEGVVCKRCKGVDHYWLFAKEQFQCKKCDFRTTLRSGTVMESSNLPFRDWFICIHLMTATKKSISALEMQRQLGYKRYQPVWEMMHKIRLVMKQREKRYKLSSFIEMDEAYFKARKDQPVVKGSNKIDRGRGSTKQGKVLVAVESMPTKTNKPGRKAKRVGRLKMEIIEDFSADTIVYEAKKMIDKNSIIWTDGFHSYNKLKPFVQSHTRFPGIKGIELERVLPWVHTAISNARKIFVGVHHSIKDLYLQNYLDEFCYKFNRRFLKEKLFDRLVVATVTSTWYK